MPKYGTPENITLTALSTLVYRITSIDGSGYNRAVQSANTKSKVEGAIINGE